MLIGSGILFVLFSDSTEQHWNKFKDDENKDNQLIIQYSNVPLEDLPSTENRKGSLKLTN